MGVQCLVNLTEDRIFAIQKGPPVAVEQLDAVHSGLIANETIDAVIGAKVETAWEDDQLVGAMVEVNVDQVLIAPNQFASILTEQRLDSLGPLLSSHTSQIHDHHARIDAVIAIEWMSSKFVVPIGWQICGLVGQTRQSSLRWTLD